jgi:DNA invertase Pin-like site-specific DNA recombinase
MLDNKPALCALYARVSTTDQHCASQLEELRSYVERRGWVVYAEFVDTGWSGAKRDRPQLAKLMKDASARRFDVVLCWKLDRFGRSVLHVMENLRSLASYGVRFMVTSQSLDTGDDSPTSRLLVQVLAAVAEFEREMIRERVKAGLVVARKKGVRLGRAPLVIDRERVWALHMRGKSLRQIAKEVCASKGTIHTVIRERIGAA